MSFVMVSRYSERRRGASVDLVPGSFGACSFFGCCLAFATSAPPPLLCLSLAHSLVRLATVAADESARSGLEYGVLRPRRPPAARADEHDVGVIERRLEVDDAALRDLHPAAALSRLGVALEQVDAFDHDLVLVGKGTQDLALLALVLARDDDHGIARGKLEPASLGLGFVFQHVFVTGPPARAR